MRARRVEAVRADAGGRIDAQHDVETGLPVVVGDVRAQRCERYSIYGHLIR